MTTYTDAKIEQILENHGIECDSSDRVAIEIYTYLIGDSVATGENRVAFDSINTRVAMLSFLNY